MITIISILFFLIGIVSGYYIAVIPFKRQIDEYKKYETLKSAKIQGEKINLLHDEFYTAYYDGKNILKDLDKISWNPPNAMSPYVGSAPLYGKYGYLNINGFQCRSDKEVVMPKPNNCFRIFLTGASTAYGSGAPSLDCLICSYLEKMLNKEIKSVINKDIEVFTLANPSWSSTHERIIIENRISEFQPDLVISLSGYNDVFWSYYGYNILWLQTFPDLFFHGLVNLAFIKSGYEPLPAVFERSDKSIPSYIVMERLKKNVLLSNYVLSQRKIDYVFCLQPTIFTSGKELSRREQTTILDELKKQDSYFKDCYSEIEKMLETASKENNFYYFNLCDVFDPYNNNEIFLDPAHFGDRGNEIIAKKILNNIIPIILQREKQ